MSLKIYTVTFKVNGGATCKKTVAASSQAHAKMEIQSYYPNDKITFMGAREER